MDEPKRRKVLQWHPAVYAGFQVELEEEAERLEFENEHQLGTKPLEVDILITKMDTCIPICKNIGQIFRRYNIIEYKSPGDYLSIDDFYKVYAYACLYKCNAGRVEQIKVSEMTVTFVCYRYPRKLVQYLMKHRGYSIEQKEEGIWLIGGDEFAMQIIVTSKLSKEDNPWLFYLNNPVKDIRTAEDLIRRYEKNKKNHLYASVMDLIVRANEGIFKEAKGMCKALEELMADELEAKRAEGKRLGMAEGRAEGRAEGKAEGKAENVLELLGDCGKIPDELRKRILYERNLDVLVRWLKLAARSGSVEEFQNAM